MSDLAQALSVAIEAAREAGALLRQEFHRPGGPRGAGGHAEIDQPAEQLIQNALLARFRWKYRGEELGYRENGNGPFIWLVDPNDGTASYLKGWRGSAVSIAALRDGVPVLGVVFAFSYPDDEGDLIAWADGCKLTRNGRPVTVELNDARLETTSTSRPVVFLSQDADRNPKANTDCVRPARYIALPSIAYRLARVAVGDGVAAVSLNGPVSWDYAGGHALVRGAGGVLLDQQGDEVSYSSDGQSSTQRCFGGSPRIAQELRERNWEQVFMRTPAPSPPFCLVRPKRGRAVADAGVLARAQGCLLGQLAGDSLGGLVEFQSVESITAEYPRGVRDLSDGGTWHNLAGQPTDDSELALMLARMLVDLGRYDRAAAIDAYMHWWPKAWDRGSTLTQALEPASRGTSGAERLRLVEEHASRSSQSNGSLMRISPLGIFGAGQPAMAADWAREDSRLTHPHPVCQESCAVFVAALATTIANGATPQACHEAALMEAERSNCRAEVRKALADARHAAPVDYTHHMGWVLIALQNAFYQLLHAQNLEEGVVDTVMRGGDTDTNAAITGALLGAVYGRKEVPPRWLDTLLCCRPLQGTPTAHPQPSEFWPVDVMELAEALLLAARP
ncbi:MAG TPA: inositol monophosphatase family protein [Pirellulales bacterium]|nr:inositol monophosphatase family protein [Pirellulales bacterium]